MACRYWYDGEFRSEEEFKSILENGLIDELVRNGVVKFKQDFSLDESLIKNTKGSPIKVPIELSILRKVQRGKNLNQERKSVQSMDSDGNTVVSSEPVQRNPKVVLEESRKKQPGKYNKKLTLLVATHQGLFVNGNLLQSAGVPLDESDENFPKKGSVSANILEELKSSMSAGQFSALFNLDPSVVGSVFMIVDSANGAYPVQLFTNKIKDTESFKEVKEGLKNIKTSTEKSVAENFRKLTNSIMYMHEGVVFENDSYKVVKLVKNNDGTIKKVTMLFKNVNGKYVAEIKEQDGSTSNKTIEEYIGDNIYRVDYTKINKGDYNDQLAKNNVIKTDLYSEEGNFFHSSNLILSYSIIDPRADKLVKDQLITNLGATGPKNASSTNSSSNNGVPNPQSNNNSKPDELKGVFDLSVDKLINSEMTTAVRYITLREQRDKDGNVVRKKKTYRVEGKLGPSGSIEPVNRILVKLNPKDKTFQVIGKFDLTEGQTKIIDELFSKDALVQKKNKAIAKAATEIELGENDGNVNSLDEVLLQAGEKQTDPNPSTNDEFDDLDIEAEKGPEIGENDIREKRVVEEKISEQKTWDKKKELEHLKKILGKAFVRKSGKDGTVRVFKNFETLKEYLPAKVYKMLLEANKNGSELYGLFTTAALLIKHNAPAGVAFHEAFHVVFNLALPIEDRIKIINEAYLKYPQLKAKVLETGKELTWLELEEFLADEFMAYANNNEKFIGSALKTDKESSLTGVPTYDAFSAASSNLKEIPTFFKGLNRMLNVFFSKNSAIDIDNLFQDINSGYYADKIEFKNTALDSSVRQMSKVSKRVTSPQRKFNSPLELEAALQTLTDLLFENIALYRQENNLKDTSISDAYVINEIGVSNLLSSVLTRVVALRKGAKQTNNKELTAALSNLLNVYTNDNKALARTEDGKKPLVVNGKLQLKESTPLLESFLADLKSRYNINITYDGTATINNIATTDDGPIFNEENALDSFIKEETTGDAVAMVNNIEVNPKETVSQVLKRFLNQIPKVNDQNGNVYNIHDRLIREDGNKIFAQLIKKISNSYSYEEMLDKLKKINRPWVKNIVEEIEKYDKNDSRNIGRSLWLSIGNKNFLYYSTIIVENGVFKRMGTNRNTLDNIIQDKIISEFLSTDNPLFKAEAGKNWKQNIVKSEAKAFYEFIHTSRKELLEILSRLNNTDPEIKKEAEEEAKSLDFKILSEFLTKYNINLSPAQIEAIFNPNLKDVKNSVNKLNGFLGQLEKLGAALSGGSVQRVRDIATRGFNTRFIYNNTPRNPFVTREGIDSKKDNRGLTGLEEESLEDNSSKADDDLLKDLAKSMEPGLATEGLFAFKNMDGKTIYALVYSGAINKQIEKLKTIEGLQEILSQEGSDDNFLRQLPLVQQLLDPDSQINEKVTSSSEGEGKYMSLTILDGMREERKSRGVVYSRMSDQELFGTQVAMFINNQTKLKSEGFSIGRPSYFKLGIASDSPNVHFIKAPVLDKEAIIQNLLQTARAEHSRILKIQNLENSFANSEEDVEVQDELLRIPNYIKNGKKWNTLSFLNNSEVGIATMKNGFNEAGIRKAIEEFLTEDITKEGGFFNKEVSELKKKGIIRNVGDDGSVLFNTGVIDTRITSSSKIENVEFLKLFLMNQFYYNTQFNNLFAGDGAFYKGTTDMQKRFKQLFSPGTYTLSDGNLEAVILDDIEEISDENLLSTIDETIESSNLSDAAKRLTKEIWTKKHNITDAATILSLRRRKEILQDLDRWTPKMEESLKRIEKGEDTLADFYTINDNPFAAPAKPFFYSLRNVNGTRVPLQIKNAEFVPTPAFALQKEGNNYKYPKLAALYLDLNGGKNLKGKTVDPKFDVAIFESAIKVGAVANKVTIDDKGNYEYEFNSYEEVDGEFVLKNLEAKNGKKNTILINKADYRLQQETPPHFIDDRSNFSTQTRNIIIQDLVDPNNPDNQYDLGIKSNGEIDSRNGEETALLFQEIVSNDLERSYNEVKDEFLDSKGELDYEKLIPILQKQAKDRGYGPSYLSAISPVKDSEGNITSYLPLYHPKIAYQTQALVSSIIRNRVTKQKINGGQVANASSFGISEIKTDSKLEMKIENGGIVLEAIMPWASAKFFPTDENGNIDIKKLQETEAGRDLLEIVANRIPTEDKYSIFNIRIVGFSPQSMGGQIILPKEITTIAGLDFDIDKLFFMMKNFYYTKNGEIKIDKFVDKLETKEEQEDLASSIYSSPRSYERFLNTIGIRGSQKQIKLDKYFEERDAYFERLNFGQIGTEEAFDIKAAKEKRAQYLEDWGKDSYYYKQQNELIEEYYSPIPLNESLYSENQIKELENIKSFLKTQPSQNIIRLNGKKASDNKKIDIIKGVLKNKYTTPMILETGNFETLHAYASRIRLLRAGKFEEAKFKGKKLIEAANKLDEDNDFNINYPSTQLELFRRNMDGTDLTGIFANHTSHHAKAQHTNLRLKKGIVINKQLYQSLNQSIDPINKTRISRTLAIKDAAVVDNAKEPLAGFLNINYFTADTVALSDRLGVPEGFTYALINQPVILELTRNFFNDPGTFNPGGMIFDMKADLVQKIQKASPSPIEYKKIYEAVNKALDKTLDTQILENNLFEPKVQDVQFLLGQLTALTLFENLYNIGTELGTGVQAGRVDTQALNPTNAENFVIIQKQKQLVNKEQDEETPNYIEGLSEIFIPGRSATQIMIPSFNEYGILLPTSEILEKINPSVGTYDSNNARFDYSFLGNLKQSLANELKANGLLNEKHARLIDQQFINYIATSFPFFDASQSKDIILNTPTKLKKLRAALNNPNSQLSKAVNDNVEGIDNRKAFLRLLNSLDIKGKEKNMPLENRIHYYKSGKGKEDFQTTEVIWEQMLNSPNPVIRDFALDLVKYSFFNNGYGYGPYSLADLIPPSFWGDEYQATLNPSGITFNQHIKTIFKGLKDNNLQESSLALNIERFKKQFIQAFGKSSGLVKTTQALPITGKKAKKLTPESNVREFVRAADSGRAIDLSGNLLVDSGKNRDFINENTGRPLKYVRRYVKNRIDNITGKRGSYVVYQHTDTEFINAKQSVFTYTPINLTSLPNAVLILDMNNDIEKSWLDKSPSKSSLEESLERGSTSTGARKAIEESAKQDPPIVVKKVVKGSSPVTKVISGGQTGVDTLGLIVARALGIETGGIAPKGYKTEEGSAKQLLSDFGLTESSSENYTVRTEENVINSDGTVYFAEDKDSKGLKLTKARALINGKPFLVNPSAKELVSWMRTNKINILNIAGNRKSKLTNAQLNNIENILKEALAPQSTETDKTVEKNPKKESKSIKEFKPGQRVQDENYQIFEILSLEEWQKETKIPNMTSGVKARFITNVNPNLRKRADDLNPDSTTYTKPGSLITMPENTLVSLVEKTKKEGGLFEEGPKKEAKKDSSGIFEEGPANPYNYAYRDAIKKLGISKEGWDSMSIKDKQTLLDCNGI